MRRGCNINSVLTLFGAFGCVTFAWNLALIGLNESYRVHHVSIHYFRSFICIESESRSFPTLIESSWPENFLAVRSKVFPYWELHQVRRWSSSNDCSRIQQAKWTEIDSLNRLWVMDVGRNRTGCPPKLLVFDLIRNNIAILRINCKEYLPSGDRLLAVKLGPRPSNCQSEKFVYFVISGETHLIAYDIVQQNWQRITLTSVKFNAIEQSLPIQPHDIAFGSGMTIFISDRDGLLYRSDNALLSNTTNNGMQMELRGSLLGRSKGMIMDNSGIIYYVVPEFGALVRCQPKRNLTAEGNEVIFMTSRNIQQIFFGAKASVWLLSDRMLSPHEHCHPLAY